MTDKSSKLIERLFESEKLNPVLKASYQDELSSMLEPKLTRRKAMPGIVLLVVLVACTIAIVRNMVVYDPEPLILLAWGVLVAAFSWVSYLIVRDLKRRKHSPKATMSIGHILMTSAAAITVITLLIGLNAPDDPSSTFNAFFMFVWYFACFSLALENRIAAAELAAREQMLRIEYRLADLAERLQT
jgi:Kef-type K+ transport system membrane component KefB